MQWFEFYIQNCFFKPYIHLIIVFEQTFSYYFSIEVFHSIIILVCVDMNFSKP